MASDQNDDRKNNLSHLHYDDKKILVISTMRGQGYRGRKQTVSWWKTRRIDHQFPAQYAAD